MKWLTRLADFFEKRSAGASVSDSRFWHSFFQSVWPSKAGQIVTPDNALNSTIVFACVRVLAETIAALPLNVYRKRANGTIDIAEDHPLQVLLHDLPNDEQTSFEMREMAMGHLNLRGNFFALKEYDGSGRINRLVPLHPGRMLVYRDPSRVDPPNVNTVAYQYTFEDGKTQLFRSDEIWHQRGLSTDGLVGVSPISLAREAIGISLGAEDYGARFFSNDATPGGILEYPGALKDDAADRLRRQWQDALTGENRRKVTVLEKGLKWIQVGLSNEDSQFLQTRQFQIEDISRIFRVPPVLIGHSDKASTYASAEQFFLSFVTHTVLPWCVRIEQSANRALLSEKDRRKYFIKHKIDGLLRGDISSRYNSYAVGRQWGWLSVNDIRGLENMNPIDGGDIYMTPLNMSDTSKPAPAKAGNGGPALSDTDVD